MGRVPGPLQPLPRGSFQSCSHKRCLAAGVGVLGLFLSPVCGQEWNSHTLTTSSLHLLGSWSREGPTRAVSTLASTSSPASSSCNPRVSPGIGVPALLELGLLGALSGYRSGRAAQGPTTNQRWLLAPHPQLSHWARTVLRETG